MDGFFNLKSITHIGLEVSAFFKNKGHLAVKPDALPKIVGEKYTPHLLQYCFDLIKNRFYYLSV